MEELFDMYDNSHHSKNIIGLFIEKELESVNKEHSYIKGYEYEYTDNVTMFGIIVNLILYVNENEYLMDVLTGGNKIEEIYHKLTFEIRTSVIFVKDKYITNQGEVIWIF